MSEDVERKTAEAAEPSLPCCGGNLYARAGGGTWSLACIHEPSCPKRGQGVLDAIYEAWCRRSAPS